MKTLLWKSNRVFET